MSDSGELRIIQRMEDQQQITVSHERRIQEVESRITTVEVRLPYMQDTITKLASIAEQQTKQGALTEQAVIALKDGQEQHNRHIEDLTKGHVDMKARLDAIWRIMAMVGTALLMAGVGYLFTLLAHPK